MKERHKGTTKRVAAARAGMSERTARKYERTGKLPSQLKGPRTWRTRVNPFEEDWPWVVEQLERDPARPRTTLFALLCAQHPGRYRPTQVRTLQRQIREWKALHGPEQEVIFEQVHTPGERMQSDFTHMDDRGVQYASTEYVARLRSIEAQVSMEALGNPYDNAKAESFFKTLKREEVYLKQYQTVQEAEDNIREFIEDVYNTKRLHSSLGYLPPTEFEEAYSLARETSL